MYTYIYIYPYVIHIYIYMCIYIYCPHNMYNPYLAGGFNSCEKYYIVNWDDYSRYMEK